MDRELTDAAPNWERLPGNECLHRWAQDVGAAIAANDNASDRWDIVGRGIVLLSDDEAACTAVLRRVAADAGIPMLFVGTDDVADFLTQPTQSEQAPALVYLEPGRWASPRASRDDDDTTTFKRTMQQAAADMIAKFDPAHPIILVTYVERIQELALKLRSPGVFDRFFRVQPPRMAALGEDVIDRIGRESCSASVTLHPEKVGVLFGQEYLDDRRRGLALLRIRRFVAASERPLEFLDLVQVAVQGYAEASVQTDQSVEKRRQTAVHEAGHAVMAIVGSNGRNVPECSSIIPTAHYSGVVVDSMQYVLDVGDEITYVAMRDKVRVRLAGRVAEDLVFGSAHVSSGASEDLKRATLEARRAFSEWGFAPSMDREGGAALNLAVVDVDDDGLTVSEAAHVEGMVRTFLATEYGAVRDVLQAHRTLLDAMTEALLRDGLLDQGAMAELMRQHAPTTTNVADSL